MGMTTSGIWLSLNLTPARVHPERLLTPDIVKLEDCASTALPSVAGVLLALVGYRSATNSVDYQRQDWNIHGKSIILAASMGGSVRCSVNTNERPAWPFSSSVAPGTA